MSITYRNQDKREPEDWSWNNHLEHVPHVWGKAEDWPDVTVDNEEEEPDQDTSPDAGVTRPGPCIHLETSLETSGDDLKQPIRE